MRDVIYLLFHLLTTLTKLIRPGGSRTVIAENLLLQQQLIIHSRARERAANLSAKDRALLGFWSLFLNPRQIGHYHQTIHFAPLSMRTEEAKVSAAVLTRWWTQNWAQVATQRNYRCRRRDETAEPTNWLPLNFSANQPGL